MFQQGKYRNNYSQSKMSCKIFFHGRGYEWDFFGWDIINVTLWHTSSCILYVDFSCLPCSCLYSVILYLMVHNFLSLQLCQVSFILIILTLCINNKWLEFAIMHNTWNVKQKVFALLSTIVFHHDVSWYTLSHLHEP